MVIPTNSSCSSVLCSDVTHDSCQLAIERSTRVKLLRENNGIPDVVRTVDRIDAINDGNAIAFLNVRFLDFIHHLSKFSDVVNDERVGREAKEVKEMKEEGRKEGRTGIELQWVNFVAESFRYCLPWQGY